MRIRIDLAYDGSKFHGWAAQPGLRTVQGELQAAIATALRMPEARVVVAGRTDTGVHARGQVAHLDVEPEVVAASAGRSQDPPLEALVRRLNGILPADLRIHRAVEAPAEFDARFSALWRRYAYRVADRPEYADPLRRHHVLFRPRPLDLDAMNVAAVALVGLHDYASFCKPREGATTIRTVHRLVWERDETGVAVATVVADAFCHSMVRALVGCLLLIGDGRQDAAWAGEILAAATRSPSVPVAPAAGLTLEEVGYPPDAELGARLLVTRARRRADEVGGADDE
ncbi:tRNA pseudouridine(38-40) synthase TruA [Nocardioides sp. DS6]|uniref:tRNA pseudouridine synthase A n=1 Tax=Nocardioides eburneus TaxID=3231482 RepID=A0ABV3SUS8_9ACTN